VLRRSMAAWSRRGGMEHMHQRLVSGMLERGYSEQFAEQIFQQIRGFGEYGFPESHAASFALLVYVSAWLKRHHPAAFTCALLNSQPMGFYQPAQLVQDARHHGVKVLPADVRHSDWDCTLENCGQEDWGQSKNGRFYSDPKYGPGLRLGLRLVKGMRHESAKRIAAARRERPFASVQDLADRAHLDRHDLAVLAEAAALRGLAGHRHRARWAIAAVEKPVDDLLGQAPAECRSGFSHDRKTRPDTESPSGLRALLHENRGQSKNHSFYSDPKYRNRAVARDGVSIRPPSEVEDIHADYASTGLTLGRHPVALARGALKRRRAITAKELHALPHGAQARACGLITLRQRPLTASGTVFLTLEDETGHVNAVIWSRLFEKQRATILSARLLAIDGVMETDGDVHHLIANRVFDFSELVDGLDSRSRDFC